MATLETRPGLLEGKQVLVMGLLSPQSYAWSIGEEAIAEGANVQYTVQDEQTVKRTARNFRNQGIPLNESQVLPCDVTRNEDIDKLVADVKSPLDGMVYSIAYVNPKTALGVPLWETPVEDVLRGFHASAIGLVSVVGGLVRAEKFNPNASVVAMTFDSRRAYPNYGWMGPIKGALEGINRYLAMQLGPEKGLRFNCVSAGPQTTVAASSIPGFKDIGQVWKERSPKGWDLDRGRVFVARSAVYLLSDRSEGVTGGVHDVDGGYQSVAFMLKNDSLE